MTIVRTVVFDLDGTLIDSNWLHLRSWQTALDRLGLSIPDQEIIDRLGLRTVDIARGIVSGHGEQPVTKLVELKSKLFEESWRHEIKPRDGAIEILQMIRSRGLRSAVASSNTSERITKTVKHFGMENLLDALVGIDEVEEGKPNPALVTAAINKLRGSSEQSIYIGDSKYDIEAGRAAGTRTVLVVQSIAAQSNLKVQPDYRVTQLLDLQEIICPEDPQTQPQ